MIDLDSYEFHPTHTGVAFGCVPVLVDMRHPDSGVVEPEMEEGIAMSGRWFWCDWLLDYFFMPFYVNIFRLMENLGLSPVDDDSEYLGFPVRITGVIKTT